MHVIMAEKGRRNYGSISCSSENESLHSKNPPSTVKLKYVEESNEIQSTPASDKSAEQPNNDILVKEINYEKLKLSNGLYFIKNLKVELLMFTYMFAYTVKGVTSTSLHLEKACTVHLKYSRYICDHLDNFTDYKREVEQLTNNYGLAIALTQMIPSAIIACILGPWSDKYGRKIPLIIALVGMIIDSIGSMLCAFFIEARLEYSFIPAIFSGFSGSFIVVLTVLYSVASDVTTSRMRTLKYALLEIAFGAGVPIGSLAGGWIFMFYGFVPVFATSLAGHTFGILWVIFCIDETRGTGNKDSWKTKIRHLFSCSTFVDGFKAVIKKRPNQGVKQIWLIILASSITVLSYASSLIISYLYAYHRYNWSNTKYSTVSAVFSVVSMVSMIITVPLLMRVFKFGDPALGIVGTSSHLAKDIVIGLAEEESLYYLGNLLGVLSGVAVLAGRSRISKIVPKSDIGKVFAFFSTAEAIIPIAASIPFSQVFNASLSFYPGLTYLVLAALLCIPLSVYVWLACLPPFKYEETPEDILIKASDEPSADRIIT